MKRLLLTFSIVCTALTAWADRIGEWNVYPAYWVATQNVTVGSRVYAVMSDNLVCYDTDDQSVRTYDSMHDLNDTHITHLAYSQEAKRLIVVYEDCNIDLLSL
ncbi:MAG: hypothetical protein HUK02_06760, partial [Bacteroidaceae bacterium]|nr:hypothetical protein [Bacteroidaceae bacterium]